MHALVSSEPDVKGETAVMISETIPLSRSEQWTVERAVAAVADSLDGVGRLGVAFSGGVDSSLLLALAVRALDAERVVALLGVSPSLAADERSAAHDVARQVGVRLVEVMTYEGDRPEYQANGADRCFHCKEELFSRIDDGIADRYGLDAVAYGENADDARRPDRPGARAATNHHVLRPLADAGITKAAVRTLARALGLQVADKLCAVPRVADSAPPCGDTDQTQPDRARRVGVAAARLRGTESSSPRRRRADRAASCRSDSGGQRSASHEGAGRRTRRRLPICRGGCRWNPVRSIHPAARHF